MQFSTNITLTCDSPSLCPTIPRPVAMLDLFSITLITQFCVLFAIPLQYLRLPMPGADRYYRTLTVNTKIFHPLLQVLFVMMDS